MGLSNTTLMLHLPPRIAAVSRKTIERLGHRALVVRRPQEALEMIEEHPIEMFLFRIDDPKKDCALFEQVRSKQPHCQGIALLSPSLKGDFPLLDTKSYPDHLIPDKAPGEIPDLAVTISKVLSRDVFGIEKYSIPTAWRLFLSSSDDKAGVLHKVREHFRTKGAPESALHRVSIALDEMIMNAVFDAPRGPGGRRLYYHRDRSSRIDLPPAQWPEIAYGMRGSSLAFSVSDRFGAFDQKTFFSFVNRLRTHKSLHPSTGKGAGMGLFLIFRALDEMVINVDPGRRTEFIGLIHLRHGRAAHRRRRRAFHFFHID